MRLYKEINRLIKNYTKLKYDTGMEYNPSDFEEYLSGLLDLLIENKLIVSYKIGITKNSEITLFTLVYYIDGEKTGFMIDLAV